jgi:hypothetical protein
LRAFSGDAGDTPEPSSGAFLVCLRQATERELQQDVRKRAQEDGKHDRRLESWARRRTHRSGYEGWLDEHDAPRGLSSRERFSVNDDLAETVVATGGGGRAST